MFERFTDAARTAVLLAQEEARRLGHDQVSPDHLLLAVLSDDEGPGPRVLRELGLEHDTLAREAAALGSGDAEALRGIGIDLDAVRRRAEEAFGPGALDQPPRRRRSPFRRKAAHMPFTAGTRKALEQSLRQALALGHGYIGTEHIVLGLVADDTAPAARTLDRLGIVPARVRERLREELGKAA